MFEKIEKKATESSSKVISFKSPLNSLIKIHISQKILNFALGINTFQTTNKTTKYYSNSVLFNITKGIIQNISVRKT